MRKIGFLNYTAYFSLAFVCGVGFTAGMIYLNKPVPPMRQTASVVNYDNVNLFRSNIISKNNPFLNQSAPVDTGNPSGSVGRPSIPNSPTLEMNNRDALEVLGVLPPDTCIIRKGTTVLTAKANEKTDIGQVGAITSKGVYVDGSFVPVK